MRRSFTIALVAGAAALAACNSSGIPGPESGGPSAGARAVPLVNASGQAIGEVRVVDNGTGATLLVTARSLPAGVHGIHVHDVGVCDPPDFKSAGPHWNPTNKQHGAVNPQGAHVGDLQNVTVAPDGSLDAEIAVPGAAGPMLDTNGAALVIHADPDDYRTDPSGNSGARIACAVLGSQ